jgi:hypothetical protein
MMLYLILWLLIGLAVAEYSYRQAVVRGRLAPSPKDDAGAYFLTVIAWAMMLWLIATAITRGR